MPLPSSLVGTSSEPRTTEVDARWTMAYAAALGDTRPCYFDTREPHRVVAHPMFPVCIEWPVIVALGRQLQGSGTTAEEFRRGVHATHDLTIHRAIRPPEKLVTRATIVAIESRKPGAYQLTRLTTTDASGAPVMTSWYGSLYRGVEVAGGDRTIAANSELPRAAGSASAPLAESFVPVSHGLAHVYTECAQIWNPIHTDIKVATDAGLPALILHGTATLALAVSRIVESVADGDPTRIARIAGRFSAMVLMPSEIRVRILARSAHEGADLAHFEVRNQEGETAISNGAILIHRR